MEKEQVWPIYSFWAKWTQKGDTDRYKDRPNWTKDLPEGRIWNATQWNKMYREEKSQEELDIIIKEWWDNYSLNKLEGTDPKIVSLKVEYVEHDTWYLTWFNHETFDIGLSDQEVLESFERFVSKKEALNEESQHLSGKDAYCLMGAEDRWRWRGWNDEFGDPMPAPCRCEHCKSQGVIRIGH